MILSVVLVSVFSLTIVYAALSVTLNITGNSEVVASSWDIHLENVKVTSGSVSGTTPSITSSRTASFSTILNNPGDFYEFTIDVVNDGSIDAMIDGVSKTPTLTTAQAKYLNYIVEYENGESINVKQLVSANSFVRLRVRVEFRKDISVSDLPDSKVVLELAFKVNYIQGDDSGSSVENNGKLIKWVSGNGTKEGDEVCIGSECFYVISSTNDTLTMMTKYNLLVGNRYDGINGSIPLENSTGIQDETAIGWFSGYNASNPLIGTKPFSSTNYWKDIVPTYPAYVYDENSYLYEYVENYKIFLENLSVDVSDARLVTIEELENLGCVSVNRNCREAPSWVYSTTYWAGTVSSSFEVWHVGSDGVLNDSTPEYSCNGVRPVIVVSKDYFN
jgi:hypothetical protein